MSFHRTSSGVSIANIALGLVSETKTIASMDDPGRQAQAVRTHYVPIVRRLLEMHHWGLATKRQALVGGVNDRSAEWLYAYAPPDDMAFPVSFGTAGGVSAISYYRGLGALLGMIGNKPVFQFQSNVLYTNYAGDLEYVSYNITEADFTPTFENIVTLMLASRLALELPKDKTLSESFAADAEREINLAITQNLNAGNRKYGQIFSEAEAARGSMFGHNWDYFPLGPGQ